MQSYVTRTIDKIRRANFVYRYEMQECFLKEEGRVKIQ